MNLHTCFIVSEYKLMNFDSGMLQEIFYIYIYIYYVYLYVSWKLKWPLQSYMIFILLF